MRRVSDRNLRLGIMTLKLGLVNRGQLMAAAISVTEQTLSVFLARGHEPVSRG